MATLSVIIPSYNRAGLIGETIANVLAQTRPADEVIVIDDGSTDDSVTAIRAFGDRVRLLQQPNQGPGAARNAGLRLARGDYIQFQDSDDLFSANKLAAQLAALERSGADIAFSPWVKARLAGGVATLDPQVLQQAMPPSAPSLPCWWLRGWSTVFQGLLFRRTLLARGGEYRTDLTYGEDGEYFFRLLLLAPRVVHTTECLTLYRLHDGPKLTEASGLPDARKLIDWARCLHLFAERRERAGLKLDLTTRTLFLASVRQHLRYLEALPDAPADLLQSLRGRLRELPATWLALAGIWHRARTHVRHRLSGSRWMRGYSASPPTPHQLALIRELGFTPERFSRNHSAAT